jgi:hypothetical protein
MKQELKDILLANSTFIQFIGILDQDGNEVISVALQSLKDSVKEKSYQFVYKTVKSNFFKTCAGNLCHYHRKLKKHSSYFG